MILWLLEDHHMTAETFAWAKHNLAGLFVFTEGDGVTGWWNVQKHWSSLSQGWSNGKKEGVWPTLEAFSGMDPNFLQDGRDTDDGNEDWLW